MEEAGPWNPDRTRVISLFSIPLSSFLVACEPKEKAPALFSQERSELFIRIPSEINPPSAFSPQTHTSKTTEQRL